MYIELCCINYYETLEILLQRNEIYRTEVNCPAISYRVLFSKRVTRYCVVEKFESATKITIHA